jgi:hypothetical protein
VDFNIVIIRYSVVRNADFKLFYPIHKEIVRNL